MISFIIILLIATNIITIYLLNRKEIKKYFAKSFIKSVNLEKVNKIFESEKISENLYGPKKDVIVKSFCAPSGDKDIVGKTSDYEAWILSSLSKISKNIFEFGTCSGKTTTLMALNSPNLFKYSFTFSFLESINITDIFFSYSLPEKMNLL